MTFKLLSRLAGVAALTIGLAGCMDVTMEIDIQSETMGTATTVSVMAPDIYAMVKSGAAAGDESASGNDFCGEAGATLVENADGSATCTVVSEGDFSTLSGEGGDGAKFEVISPGIVKVSFETGQMKGELGETGDDPETQVMMQQIFEGHTITLRVKGKEIIDTNMERKNGAAELVIPFIDLFNGGENLPPELFATVRVN
jgi:hypothetical protein